MRGSQSDRWFKGLAAAVCIAGCVLLGAATSAEGQPCDGGVWSPLIQRPTGEGRVAFDAARQTLVWFNGSQTWESDTGEAWVLRATSGPGPRTMSALAYDPGRRVCILFGGEGVYGTETFSDTWQWDGNVWTRISTSGPSARSGHTMVTDTDNVRIILFGGGAFEDASDETWVWDSSGWRQLHPQGLLPSPRRSCGLSYDSARHRVVLFGGYPYVTVADTWEFDGLTWSQVERASAPGDRWTQCAMAFDPSRGVSVLTGSVYDAANETWEWNGATWSLRDSQPANTRPYAIGMAYVPALGHVVRAGQANERAGWPVQEWDGSAWMPLGDAENSPPVFSSDPRMVYDSRRDRMVMFGWLGNPGTTSLWEFANDRWVPRPGEGPANGAALAYDSARGETVAVEWIATPSRHTWAWDGSSWRIASQSSPNGNAYAVGMTFDSIRNVVELYTSRVDQGPGSAMWEWNGSSWIMRSSETAPGSILTGVLAFDAARGRTVLYSDDRLPPKTWEWDGTSWYQGHPVHYPLPSLTIPSSLIYDSVRQRTVLLDGPVWFPSMWEWDGLDWTPVETRGQVGAAAYDPVRNRIVCYSGANTWVRTAAPVITGQPASQSVVQHEDVSFGVLVNAPAREIGYAWRQDMVPLVNGGRISGADGPILSIAGVLTSDVGSYDVVVSNACGSATSSAAMLSVAVCTLDFNADSILNSQDFFDYLNAFFASSLSADFDHSGTVDSQDFFAFLDAFFAGC